MRDGEDGSHHDEVAKFVEMTAVHCPLGDEALYEKLRLARGHIKRGDPQEALVDTIIVLHALLDKYGPGRDFDDLFRQGVRLYSRYQEGADG